MALGLNDVNTSRVSQGVVALWSGVAFAVGWTLVPKVPPRRILPKGHFLLTEGFKEVFKTARDINKTYRRGLRFYFLALIFAESAVSAFTNLSVVFLDQQMGLSGSQIGIFFLITLLFTLIGSRMGSKITARTNPKLSYQLSMLCITLYAAGGAILLDYVPTMLVFVWAIGIGMLLGWFYPVGDLFFSMCAPKGQEAVRLFCICGYCRRCVAKILVFIIDA